METQIIAIGIIGIILLGMVFLIVSKISGKKTNITISSHTIIERLKEIGELSVLRAYVKEIGSSKHSDFFILWEGKKIIVICTFEIEYRYNISAVQIIKKKDEVNSYVVKMPPYKIKTIPERVEVWSEVKGKFLGIVSLTGFSIEERNSMTDKARKDAEEKAIELSKDLEGKIENSAEKSLRSLFNALDINNVEFEFEKNTSMIEQIKKGMEKIEVK
jgi:hypothetical protein